MPRLARFVCPACGKQVAGDALDWARRPACKTCGRQARLWVREEPAAVPPPRPPAHVSSPVPPPVRVSSPVPATTGERSILLWWLIGTLALVVLALAVRLQFRSGSERERVALANRVVAAKVEAARAHLAKQDFDVALSTLDDALNTEHATQFDDARVAVLQVRHGQADALLEGAAAAVGRRDPAGARRLLQEYLAHPHATQKPKATLLLDELARATDDAAAVRLLAQLPDDKITVLADKGPLTDGALLTDRGMRELYQAMLQRHLPRELETRAARARRSGPRRRNASASRPSARSACAPRRITWS